MNNLEITLNNELKKLKINLENNQINLLINFIELIYKWNKTYNLTSIQSKEEMLYKHIIDSIVISNYLNGENFIDVGTGPGLPGIPLAIINPRKNFYLLDSLTKRINFIRQVKRELNLTNIHPILSRCEEYNKEVNFDGILSRAFASLKDMINISQNLASENTVFYALKGQLIKNEIAEIPQQYKISDIINLDVPAQLGTRHLIKVVKG